MSIVVEIELGRTDFGFRSWMFGLPHIRSTPHLLTVTAFGFYYERAAL